MDRSAHSPIDAVITWVDGNDPAHAAKRERYAGVDGVRHPTAKASTRFDSQGEIYVCVASILKFLPFIRTIWIVTDAQTPEHIGWYAQAGLCAEDRIQIVDHRDILGDWPDVLPTFNSLTIEAALWRIPGLADQHIYFNDDVFVKRELSTDFFFDENGLPIVRGVHRSFRSTGGVEWLKHEFLRPLRPNHWGRASFRTAQENAALLLGHLDQFIHQEHWAHPMDASILRAFYTENDKVFRTQIRPRFRERWQHWPVGLHDHLVDLPVSPNPIVAYAKPGRHEEAMLKGLVEDDADFGCMQSLDQVGPDKTARLFDGLVSLYAPYLRRDMLGTAASSINAPSP